MYNPQKPWESEHAGYFNSKKDKQYHKEDKAGYNSGGNPSSEYNRNRESKEKEDDKKDSWLDEGDEKKDAKITDEEIPFKAARQVFAENQREEKKDDLGKKKNLNSIEEAIKKAIEDEKKILMMD